MFSIAVYLPTDRALPGFLRLWTPGGVPLLYDIPCRGKSDGQNAAANGNPKRDPTRPWGDTPAGLYATAPVTVFSPVHATLGRIAILLEGVSGDALRAKENGRTGLAIHAGRGNDRLMATYGCIRVFDRDMELIAGKILADDVSVDVIDIPDWPPL